MAGDRRTRGRGVGLPESSTPGTPVVAPEDEALVVLAVRGPMEASALASALALDGRVTRSLVACQAARGLLEEDAGGRARLTGAGLAAAGAVLAREQHALGPATAGLAERFDDLNRRVKAAITDWQVVRVGSALVPNDHSDPRRDAAVIERLMQAGSAAAQLLRPLSRARRRIEVLLRRLDEALSRVVAGGSDWICGLGVDSVHSVWWSLHAELLALLGRERGEADA